MPIAAPKTKFHVPVNNGNTVSSNANKTAYIAEYVDTLMSYTPGWMFPVLFVVTFLGGILGALLGKAVLKKHFEKAGIV